MVLLTKIPNFSSKIFQVVWDTWDIKSNNPSVDFVSNFHKISKDMFKKCLLEIYLKQHVNTDADNKITNRFLSKNLMLINKRHTFYDVNFFHGFFLLKFWRFEIKQLQTLVLYPVFSEADVNKITFFPHPYRKQHLHLLETSKNWIAISFRLQ